jgi:hypothetical protein
VTARSVALFVAAALAEIGGAYLVWIGLREHKGALYVVLGGLVLALYGVVATYDTDYHGPRALIGARIDGDPHLFDVPADGNTGTRYLVESGLTSNAELHALIADYLAKADRLGYPPMHGWI